MPYRVLSWPSLMVTITRSCATSWKSSIFKFRSAIFLHAPGQELSQLSRGTNLHNSSLSNLSSQYNLLRQMGEQRTRRLS